MEKEVEKQMKHKGGQKSFDRYVKIFDSLGVSYKIIMKGGVREIHYGNHVLRFSLVKSTNDKVGTCCSTVIKQANKFTKEHGILEHEISTTYKSNNRAFVDYFMRGGREVVAVDVKACYWTIAYEMGIINEKTFNKYFDEKELRLTAIGNLKKPTTSSVYKKGKPIKGSNLYFANPNEWVWDYIVYRTYKLFEEVDEAVGNEVFLFKTDCFFAASKHKAKIEEVLDRNGFGYRSEIYDIVGRDKGRCVLDDGKGNRKLSLMPSPIAFNSFLEVIEMPKHKIDPNN